MIDRWSKAQEEASRYVEHATADRLAHLASSPDASERRVAVAIISKQIAAGDARRDYVAVLRTLADDPDHTCRWQSLILLSEFIWCGQPEVAWDLVLEHADSEDSDLRAAIACLLLEHLLEEHFDEYFPRLRELARAASPRTLDTISGCWFDDFGPRYQRVQKLVRNANRGGCRSS